VRLIREFRLDLSGDAAEDLAEVFHIPFYKVRHTRLDWSFPREGAPPPIVGAFQPSKVFAQSLTAPLPPLLQTLRRNGLTFLL
jgi:hypothetical protein